MALKQMEDLHDLRQQQGLCPVCGGRITSRTRCGKCSQQVCENGHRI